MTDLQGAVGLVQLKKLDRLIDERSRWAAFYRRELAKLEVAPISRPSPSRPPRLAGFVTYVRPRHAPRRRDRHHGFLQDRGIATRPGTHAVHMLGYYRNRFGLRPDDFPVARDCSSQSMAIPLHSRMTEDDYAYVAEALQALRSGPSIILTVSSYARTRDPSLQPI